MITRTGIALCLMLLAGRPAQAAMVDFISAFEVNLETDNLPTLQELEDWFEKQESIYDTRYTSVFDLGEEFNRDFYTKMTAYGNSEKRLKGENEDIILELLNSLPKEMYEYIGPMLFTIPNMSEKVLNLPGIRETKNRFPRRIAPQLQNVEDLEFLSPYLYYLLMPEMWNPESRSLERPRRQPAHPKVVYDEKFYAGLRKIVPPEQFMAGAAAPKKLSRSDLRTVNPQKDSLLTAKDVAAFARTLDGVQEWTSEHIYQLSKVSTMLLQYELSRPDNQLVSPALKDMVNPCQRLVQKATIMGRERELAMVAAKEGFTLNEWAYTCDKTIKAYRLSHISRPLLLAIKSYQKGIYDGLISRLSPMSQKSRYAAMQAIVEMYRAPLSDVLEVRKKRRELQEKWLKYDFKIGMTPLGRLD